MTIKTWALSLTAVLVGWFGLQLLVMRFTDAAPGAVVLFPTQDFITQLPADVAVVGGGSNWLAIKSDRPNLGQSLNTSGAWIVLPAGLPGCLPLL
jgi:hypothetical protein